MLIETMLFPPPGLQVTQSTRLAVGKHPDLIRRRESTWGPLGWFSEVVQEIYAL